MDWLRMPDRNWILAAAAFSLAALLAAASPQEKKAAPGTQSQEPAAPKVPGKDDAPAPVDPKTYKIGAEDVLNIRVWREPELSGNVVVRPDGKVTLPLAGEVDAAGLTPEQFGVRVAEALGKFLNKPEVIIAVASVQSKRYFISGNVSRSGPVPLVTPTTILQALSSAGLGQWAKKNKIIVMRGTDRIRFDYSQVIKGKKLEQNIYLQDGDHIFVP
ncbi:MAG: polysaccharide biosynthesis/export family protein [Candidatus Solibacter usitatus]|nr:polysaccharide biosynthesis/export family protein [Candidatus Solibacter usitatus]